MAVAIEVAGAGNMPVAGHDAGIGDQLRPRSLAVVPNADRAVVVLPENVMLATVKIARDLGSDRCDELRVYPTAVRA